MEEGDVLGISELDSAITADHVPLSLFVIIEVSLRVGIGNAASFHLERKPQAAKALSGAQNKVFALRKKTRLHLAYHVKRKNVVKQNAGYHDLSPNTATSCTGGWRRCNWFAVKG